MNTCNEKLACLFVKNLRTNRAKVASCLFAIIGFSIPFAHVYSVDVSQASPQPVEIEAQIVAINDGGLWPTLTLLPDNSILLVAASQKNRISAGDLDAWRSVDGGKTWSLQGTVVPRLDEYSNWTSHAIGFLPGNRSILVLAGGTSDQGNSTRKALHPVIRSSSDWGKTWASYDSLECGLVPEENVSPFGIISPAPDGSIRVAVSYEEGTPQSGVSFTAYMLTSRNAGKNWEQVSKIGDGINETALISIGDKKWLAMARTVAGSEPGSGQELRQFRSIDDGITWVEEGSVTNPGEHPASLIRLSDGRLLLTYSERSYGAIFGRISDNDGESWGPPLAIGRFKNDGGYASSVQMKDGSIATAFYGQGETTESADVYHTAVVLWRVP